MGSWSVRLSQTNPSSSSLVTEGKRYTFRAQWTSGPMVCSVMK